MKSYRKINSHFVGKFYWLFYGEFDERFHYLSQFCNLPLQFSNVFGLLSSEAFFASRPKDGDSLAARAISRQASKAFLLSLFSFAITTGALSMESSFPRRTLAIQTHSSNVRHLFFLLPTGDNDFVCFACFSDCIARPR